MLNMQLTLKEKAWHTSEIYSLKFERPKNFEFKPGQYLTITVNINGQPERRAYSISSSPTERDLIMFTIKREDYPEIGRREISVSTKLSKLEPGDKLDVRGPFGLFTLEDSNSLVFIAGGTGITPFRCMTRYIIDKKLNTNIKLFYSARTEHDFLFNDEFNNIKEKNFKFIPTATRDTNFKGNKGRINERLLKENIKDLNENTYYICGPKLFVETVEDILKNLVVDIKKIKVDKWG